MSLTLKLLFSLVEIRNIAKAETKKVPASKPKALVTPHLSTIIPPKPKPMIAAIVAVIEIKELAKKISSFLVISGIKAILAGIKNLPALNERKRRT